MARASTVPRTRDAAPELESGRAMATAIVLLGAIMSSLGGSATTAAFPVMATAFRVTPATIAWVGLVFTLTSATLLTIFGRLADMHGRKRPYALGLAVYMAGSVLCGLSGSILTLVAWRVVQGIGAALVSANSLAYLVEIYPPRRRGALVGWWEAAIAVGQAAGPVLGGLLLAAFGWPSIFFVNLPVGLAMLALVPRFLVEPPGKAHAASRRFDLVGAGLFAGGLGLLLYGLIEAAQLGWNSPLVVVPIVIGLACGALFVWVEARTDEPMVDLNLFRSLGFSAGNAAKICAYLSFSANGFLLPFYLYRGLGWTPARVGLSLTIFPVGMLVSSLVFGPLSDRIGTRLLACAGVALLVVAAVDLTIISPAFGFAEAALAMALGGIGVGAFIAPNDSAILSVTPPGRLGVANGIMGVSRSLGLLLGQAIGGGVLSARLAANANAFLPSFHQTYAVVALLTAAGIALAAVRDRSDPTPQAGACQLLETSQRETAKL